MNVQFYQEGGGQTVIMAEAMVSWQPPRPGAEVIPASVTEVTITPSGAWAGNPALRPGDAQSRRQELAQLAAAGRERLPGRRAQDRRPALEVRLARQPQAQADSAAGGPVPPAGSSSRPTGQRQLCDLFSAHASNQG